MTTVETLIARAKRRFCRQCKTDLEEMRHAAGKVCRTAGIICEAALLNEANPKTRDGDNTTFDLLDNAVENVKELRAILAKHKTN